MADKRDDFLINLNNCKTEIIAKVKQISDNLLIRQKQLLTELDEIEKKYSESRNAENLLKPTKKYRIELNKGLQGSFLQENIISNIKVTIASLDVQIADLKQKLVTFTSIDIKLKIDNINILIDELGSVKLTEDTIVPKTGIPDSQSSSPEPSMVQYNTLLYNAPFNLSKNECQINKVIAPNQDVIIMTDLQTWSLRDNFLINLNNRRNEINTKFKQISNNLLIRQNQLLKELDGIEKKYSKSRNAENLLKQAEKYRDGQNKSLQDSFLPENITSHIKMIIGSLDVQIADLRQKLVAYTNIDIKLDTDNINTLIDKLGSVKLTEDIEYNSCVDNILCYDMYPIDPCESYSPFNNNNNNNNNDNTIVCTDALGNKKRMQGNFEDTIPKMGIPDSQILFNLNENSRPIDNNGNPECTAALRDKNTIHNAEADAQVRGRNRRQSILLPDTYQAAPDQDVNYHRSKLGFFARFINLPNYL